MSRNKLARSVVDTCADCGAVDPTWASINKGILICDECCSVHRTLGRHVSHIKSLRKGTWIPSQLAMVHALHSNGANSIWEHSLLDPTTSKPGRKKPQAKDPVKPTKSDFIRTKHQLMGFVHRASSSSKSSSGDDKDQSEGGPDAAAALDASKQLHSSVRTANLETSLRLLSCGADPNYLHQEKGTYPLHVAAGAGQASQVELLLIYGADPGGLDSAGKTPIDHATEAGYKDIAYRLLESQYELTDRLAAYLCERKPDHSSGQHFLIPEMADSIDGNLEAAKAAKRKLQMLPNFLFEEMAMDVYDEVDRRETEQFWVSLQGGTASAAATGVPFLPVHSELPAVRNQARQKLGRLNAREFTTLLIDLLGEAKRRHLGMGCHLNATINRDSKLLRQDLLSGHDYDEPLYDSVASEASEDEFRTGSSSITTAVSVEAYRDIKDQLSLSNRRMQELLASNTNMQQQIGQLNALVQSLVQENQNLKTAAPAVTSPQEPPGMSSNGPLGPVKSETTSPPPVILRGSKIAATRHFSMYEPREGYPSPRGGTNPAAAVVKPQVVPVPKATADEIVRRTNLITRRIQEVFRNVQERRQDQVEPAAQMVVEVVQAMALIVPPGCSEDVKLCVNQLTTSAARLLTECQDASSTQSIAEGSAGAANNTQRIIQGAYDVAKATKQLVTLFQ